MPSIFPNTTKYLKNFYNSKKPTYKAAVYDFKPYPKERYAYSYLDEKDSISIYQSVYSLNYHFGNVSDFELLQVPEDFPTPKKAVDAIISFKKYLEDDLTTLKEMLLRYDKNTKTSPIKTTINYTQEVIDVLEHVLTFEELQSYLNEDLKKEKDLLYNIYVRVGENRQILHALDKSEIEQIIRAISQRQNWIQIAGRKLILENFDTLQIFDSSKAFNKYYKGHLKDEMAKMKGTLNLAGVTLLQQVGIDVTDKFPLDSVVSNEFSQKNKTEIKGMKKLFISHSSEDDKKIKPFLKLINLIGVPHKAIFYCSVEGYGLKPGENIIDGLKRELTNEVFALFMISDNFYKSTYCVCEMGAIWIKSHKQIPILISPTGFDSLKGVFPNTNALKMDNKSHLNTLKEELEKYFDLQPVDFSRWETFREDYFVELADAMTK